MSPDKSLQETVSDLESFNSMVSHDLLGPLAGITDLADVALRSLTEGRLERVAESLAMIRRQGKMSSDLLSALMQLAQVATTEPNRQPVELSLLVAQALEQVRIERPEATRVRWVLHDMPLANVDPTLTQQVFVNLIGNAVKFSATRMSPRIEIGTEPGSDDAPVIFVRDNGVGLDAGSAGLFEPFTRLHRAAFDGTGLGLSIVRRIIEIHGGTIWCESRPHHGATFRFTLGRRPT